MGVGFGIHGWEKSAVFTRWALDKVENGAVGRLM
jgi:hypothetical protein